VPHWHCLWVTFNLNLPDIQSCQCASQLPRCGTSSSMSRQFKLAAQLLKAIHLGLKSRKRLVQNAGHRDPGPAGGWTERPAPSLRRLVTLSVSSFSTLNKLRLPVADCSVPWCPVPVPVTRTRPLAGHGRRARSLRSGHTGLRPLPVPVQQDPQLRLPSPGPLPEA
jgi:hypothetical protein